MTSATDSQRLTGILSLHGPAPYVYSIDRILSSKYLCVFTVQESILWLYIGSPSFVTTLVTWEVLWLLLAPTQNFQEHLLEECTLNHVRTLPVEDANPA